MDPIIMQLVALAIAMALYSSARERRLRADQSWELSELRTKHERQISIIMKEHESALEEFKKEIDYLETNLVVPPVIDLQAVEHIYELFGHDPEKFKTCIALLRDMQLKYVAPEEALQEVQDLRGCAHNTQVEIDYLTSERDEMTKRADELEALRQLLPSAEDPEADGEKEEAEEEGGGDGSESVESKPNTEPTGC